MRLRDSKGIANVGSLTGNKILRILKAKGLAPKIPEDLYHLIKKVRGPHTYESSCSPARDLFVARPSRCACRTPRVGSTTQCWV